LHSATIGHSQFATLNAQGPSAVIGEPIYLSVLIDIFTTGTVGTAIAASN
jgi:hypothetical protein